MQKTLALLSMLLSVVALGADSRTELENEALKLLSEKYHGSNIRLSNPLFWSVSDDEYLAGLKKAINALKEVQYPADLSRFDTIYLSSKGNVDFYEPDSGKGSIYLPAKGSSGLYLSALSSRPTAEPHFKEAKDSASHQLIRYLSSSFSKESPFVKAGIEVCEKLKDNNFVTSSEVRSIVSKESSKTIKDVDIRDHDKGKWKAYRVKFESPPPGKLKVTVYYEKNKPEKVLLEVTKDDSWFANDIVKLWFDPNCFFTGGELFTYDSKRKSLIKRETIDGETNVTGTTYADREVLPLDQIYASCPKDGLTRDLNDLYKIAQRGDRVLVTILDQGIDYNHPEIAFKISRPGQKPTVTKNIVTPPVQVSKEFVASLETLIKEKSLPTEEQDKYVTRMSACFKKVSTFQCHQSNQPGNGALGSDYGILFRSMTDRVASNSITPLSEECQDLGPDLQKLWDSIDKRKEVSRDIGYSWCKYSKKDLETLDREIAALRTRLARNSVGWDFEDEDPRPYDYGDYLFNFFRSYDHGTHVASIAARGSDEIALLPMKYPKRNKEFMYDAILLAHDRGSRIVNVSLGSTDKKEWEGLERAIREFPDMLFICAAGNESKDNDITPHYPSSFSYPNVLAVAATAKDKEGELASFSNYGTSSVHIAAPGEDIEAALPEKEYGTHSGTSMAAPRVTNVAAKIKAINPRLSPQEIVEILRKSVTSHSDLRRKVLFGGTLNEKAALDLAVKSLPGLESCSLETVESKVSSILSPSEPILRKKTEGNHQR